MKKKIEFITKKYVKATDPDVTVYVNGSSRHKSVRFSFRNGLGKKISKSGYIVVSKINSRSKVLYFNESSKGEGYKYQENKNTCNGAICINSHILAEDIEKFSWVGEYYKTYKEEGYYCIRKSDKKPLIKTNR